MKKTFIILYVILFMFIISLITYYNFLLFKNIYPSWNIRWLSIYIELFLLIFAFYLILLFQSKYETLFFIKKPTNIPVKNAGIISTFISFIIAFGIWFPIIYLEWKTNDFSFIFLLITLLLLILIWAVIHLIIFIPLMIVYNKNISRHNFL